MNLSEIETRVKSIISVNNSEDLQIYITKFIDEILTKNNKEWSEQCAEWMTKHEQIWNECLLTNNKIAELEKVIDDVYLKTDEADVWRIIEKYKGFN